MDEETEALQRALALPLACIGWLSPMILVALRNQPDPLAALESWAPMAEMAALDMAITLHLPADQVALVTTAMETHLRAQLLRRAPAMN